MLVRVTLIFLIVLALQGADRQAHAQEPAFEGHLTAVQGSVFLELPGKSEGAAHMGDIVPAGTRVRTAAQSIAQVTFADGSVLRLDAGSQVQLSPSKRLSAKKSVMLFFGQLWNKVAHSDANHAYEVKTPNAVCGVRGTEFVAHVADDGSLRVGVDQGRVVVSHESDAQAVDSGQQADADDQGVAAAKSHDDAAQWQAWSQQKGQRFKANSAQIVGRVRDLILARRDEVQALREQEKVLETQKKGLLERHDAAVDDELARLNRELFRVSELIADLGDRAGSQFGLVDHFADLARDPRFAGIDRKTLEAEAKSLRHVKAMFDKMVQEGTDLSMQGTDQIIKDMHDGKGDTLKDKPGSAKDLFDGDEPR